MLFSASNAGVPVVAVAAGSLRTPSTAVASALSCSHHPLQDAGVEVFPGEVGGRTRCGGARGRKEQFVADPLALGRTRTCVGLLCGRQAGVPELRARSVVGTRSSLPLPGAPSQPPARASTEHLLFQGSRRKLESRTSSPTQPGTFPAVWGGEERAAALGGRGRLEAYSAIWGTPTTR